MRIRPFILLHLAATLVGTAAFWWFVLPDQPSIRDPKVTVKDVIATASKSLGAPVTITRFARLKVGETTA